jgi:hypothetical protein
MLTDGCVFLNLAFVSGVIWNTVVGAPSLARARTAAIHTAANFTFQLLE